MDVRGMGTEATARPRPDRSLENDLETRLLSHLSQQSGFERLPLLGRAAGEFPAEQITAQREEHFLTRMLPSRSRRAPQDDALDDTKRLPLADSRRHETPPGRARVIREPRNESAKTAPLVGRPPSGGRLDGHVSR